MGTNSKTSHIAYTTTPTVGGEPGPPTPEPPDAAAAAQQLFHAYLNMAHEVLSDPDVDDADVSQTYDQFADYLKQATAYLDAAESFGLSAEEVDFGRAQVKEAALQFLDALDKDELAQIAAEHGFQHPHLVGMDGSSKALAAWLNPAYPDDSEYKAKIQAKALERYDALAAGQTVNGMTLADYHAMFGGSPPGPPPTLPDGMWEATPAEVLAAQTAALTALAEWSAVKNTGGYNQSAEVTEAKTAALTALIAAENHLADAWSPELGEGLDVAKAAMRHQVSGAIANLQPAVTADMIKAAHAAGDLTDNQAHLLSSGDKLTLLRHNTDADQRAELAAKAESRAADAAAVVAAMKAFEPFKAPITHVTSLQMPEGATAAQVAAMANAAADGQQALDAVKAWGPHDSFQMLAAGSEYTHGALPYAGHLTTEFRAWAKTRPMAQLRADAQELGLPETSLKNASRAQLQNWIASHWDSSLDKASIAAAIAAAPVKPAPAAPAPAAGVSADPAVAAAAAATTAPAAPAVATPVKKLKKVATIITPGGTKPAATAASPATPVTGFAAAQKKLISALAAAGAAHGGIPAALPASTVAAHDFGPGTAAGLGGSHQMTVHTGPYGGPWLFKPDQAMAGAKAHAEAAGASTFAKVGLPAVPVYVATIGGVTGAVQPKLAGATPFSSVPSSWSQADVDTLVRHQVAAWVTGDHDGHPANLLRTSAGGLVPIDHGTAYKHYGSDQLSLHYNPSTTTAFQLACHAYTKGSLASGVTINPMAAHPVIKAFEQMPDAEWRASLHTVAHQGVASGAATWIPEMRARAAKAHGIAAKNVSNAQIAEAFLDHAVERKQNLRATFASFFTDQLGHAAGALLKYGS